MEHSGVLSYVQCVPDVDHDDTQLFFFVSSSSSVELPLTTLAYGSLAGSFKSYYGLLEHYGSLLSFGNITSLVCW